MIAGIKHLIQFHHWPKWIIIRKRSTKTGNWQHGSAQKKNGIIVDVPMQAYLTEVHIDRQCAVCRQEARRGR